jgi:hypothetical protein
MKPPNSNVEIAPPVYSTFSPGNEDEITMIGHRSQGIDAVVWTSLLKALGIVGFVAGFALMVFCAFWIGGMDTQ